MKKIYCITILICGGCSQKEDIAPLPQSIFKAVNSFDMGNGANAADIVVETKMDIADVAEVRLIVSNAADVTTQEAMRAPDESFFKITPAAHSIVKLPGSLKTLAGGNFEHIQYFTYALAIGKNTALVLSKPDAITLSDEPVYAGKYIGTFQDSFGSKNASVILAQDYTGQMFYTQRFVSFCGEGSPNDGQVVFAFNGDAVTNFGFNQWVQCFMSGCPGVFTGSGTVTNYLTLSINFTGNDCEGDQMGVLTLSKQK